MIIGILDMVGLNVILIFYILVEIQGCLGVVLVVLKVSGDYLEWKVNCKQKGFYWIGNGCFLGSGSTNELLIDIS